MQIKFWKGLAENLSTVSIIGGQILFTTDTKKIYLDIAGTTDAPGTAESRKELYDGKQDALVFATAYNALTNKAATIKDIEEATKGLTGAMHFVGNSLTDPTAEDGPTITGVTTFESGDVCTYDKKEYVFDGTSWRELGDEGDYVVKGAIKDSDVAADAAIAQSKIAGLVDALTNLAGKETDTKDSSSIVGAKKYTDDAIATLDATDTAVDGEFVTAVSQTDGVISVTRKRLDLGALEWGEF